MPLIRTPDARFADLPEYPFAPHYLDIGGARVHYVDTGAGDPVLCLHGEPSWSFLYRRMIPVLAEHHRVVAPDFIGFGKSDKYTDTREYSYAMHRDTLIQLIERLDLTRITAVVQDWGGLIGLRVAGMLADRFARLVIMNTGLPTGDDPMPPAFMMWRASMEKAHDPPIGALVRMGTAQGARLPADIVAGYDAPFPDASYKAGARIWPLLVPVSPADPAAGELRRARADLARWTKPALVMFSDKDPITAGGDLQFRALIPSANEQPAITIQDAGHFLQEDKGPDIAAHINDFIARTPLRES